MSLFKEKTIKYNTLCNNNSKNNNPTQNSVDVKHIEIMNEFERKKQELPKLKSDLDDKILEIEYLNDEEKIKLKVNELMLQKDKILSKMEKLHNNIESEQCNKTVKQVINMYEINKETPQIKKINRLNKTFQELETKIDQYTNIYKKNCLINVLNNEKNNLEAEIYNIENNTEELIYFDETYDLLYDYYKKDDTQNEIHEVDLCDIFKKSYNQSSNKAEKIKIKDKYFQSINKSRRKKKGVMDRTCTKCNIPKILNLHEGQYQCIDCGETETVIIDSDKPSYKDPINEVKTNTYKRSNHCSELLNQSQGKESTEIEEEIFDEIRHELYVIGITDLQIVTKSIIKMVLKNIGRSTISEHAVYIINKLNGIPAPTIPHELEETVKQMFVTVEDAWYIFKDPNRKNFMNTNFVFHKIFELLGEDEEAEKYPYLADDKLDEHDELWEKICNYLEWEFISSI